jgi:hypothetical protein
LEGEMFIYHRQKYSCIYKKIAIHIHRKIEKYYAEKKERSKGD